LSHLFGTLPSQTVFRSILTNRCLTGNHWLRFAVYSLCSWTCPAAVVGTALTVNFSTDQQLEYLRPGYGGTECYINNGMAVLIFTAVPLLVIMVLNVIFFLWSACLIRSMTSEIANATTNPTNIHLYVRLALIMGLTWAVGVIAEYVNVSGMILM
jgi:hypothetical protein